MTDNIEGASPELVARLTEALTDAVAFMRGDIAGTGQRNGILCDADDVLAEANALRNTRSTSLSDEALVERVAEALWDSEGWDHPDGGRKENGALRKLSWAEAKERQHYAVSTTYVRARAAIEAIASSDTTLITALREAGNQLLAVGDDKLATRSEWHKAVTDWRALSNQPGERG